MENHAQSIDDALIGGLSYKLKAGASYVTNRRSVSYFASGGNTYSPSGVKVMKFNLTGDQWMDPSTFRVAFQLNNHNPADSNGFPTVVTPLHWNPAVFFRRARLICGGVVVEDIDDFNRLSLMLTSLMTEDEQTTMAIEGFGHYDIKATASENDNRASYRQEDFDYAGNVYDSRRVMFKPLLGMFNQEKLLPLRYMPMQLELELVNQQADAVIVGAYDSRGHAENWSISDIQCKCDLLTLDNSLDNEFASHLLSGKSLPINLSTWNHTNQSTGDDKDFSSHINRALTRLKSVFITLKNGDTQLYKQCNDFYHPVGHNDAGGHILYSYGEHQYQVQIGSKLVPEYPVTSLSESFSQLRKTVGKPFKMHSRWYRTRKYVIGLDLEKVSGAGFTGMSTKNGDLMTINFKDCHQLHSAGSVPNRMFCALNYDVVLNIRDQGVELLD
jgi:hypothetical protein